MTTLDWTAVAAIATAIMAIATFFLALKTRELVRETKSVADATLVEARAVEKQTGHVERQVAISATALRVSAQPWLVWERSFIVEQNGVAPVGFKHGGIYSDGYHPCLEVSEQNDSVVGWFTVKNVGNGLAILDMAGSNLYPRNGDERYEDLHPKVNSPVVPPGETVDIEFEIPALKSPDNQRMTLLQFVGGEGHQLFAVEVAYGDSLGNAGTSATFRAHRHGENAQWSMFEVMYKLDGDNTITTRDFA